MAPIKILGRENIFKRTIGNKSLHQDNNDDGIRIVKFATSNVQKCTLTSPDVKTQPD